MPAPAGSFSGDSRHCLTERLLRGSDLTGEYVHWRALAGHNQPLSVLPDC
jgi:hypothetical protein